MLLLPPDRGAGGTATAQAYERSGGRRAASATGSVDQAAVYAALVKHWYPLILFGIELLWALLLELEARTVRRPMQRDPSRVRDARLGAAGAGLGLGWRTFEVLFALYHFPVLVLWMPQKPAQIRTIYVQASTFVLYVVLIAVAEYRYPHLIP